jgi:hypothetical protein
LLRREPIVRFLIDEKRGIGWVGRIYTYLS